MKKLIALLLFSFLTLATYSQEKGYLEFAGKCIKQHQPIKGATVAIYKGSTKVTDLNTGKNGKFQFFLDFGVDYKVTFSYPGCADMYLMLYASKCEAGKSIFPIYEMDVNFFEYNNPTINYGGFKNPITKINYDGKKTFKDDEPYVKDFIEKLFVDPEVLNKQNVQLAIEKEKKEMDAKLRENEEKLRQQQLVDAQKQAQAEADRIKKLAEEKSRADKNTDPKNTIAKQENEEKQSMASEEVQLTIDKEKRSIKEKQNKAIRATYESDLLKIVATNERTGKESQFKKDKSRAQTTEVIETLKKDAEVKAKSEQVVFDSKTRNRQVVLNRGIKNKEMLILIKQSAFNDRSNKFSSIKKFPEVATYKPSGFIGITTDVDKSTFKTTYTYNISNGNTKTTYKRDSFNWGLNYYYKNDKEILEIDYLKELSQYNIR